jgi:hypothetical protein
MKKIDYYFKNYKISIILLVIFVFIIFLLYILYKNIEKRKIKYKNEKEIENFFNNSIITTMQPNKNNNNCNSCNSSGTTQIFDYGIEDMSTNNSRLAKIILEESSSSTPSFNKINFHKLFNTPPKVFTQIILNDANNTENVMTVDVFNITPQSFNYTIRGVSNKNIGSSGKMKGIMLNNNYPVKFSWMALE